MWSPFPWEGTGCGCVGCPCLKVSHQAANQASARAVVSAEGSPGGESMSKVITWLWAEVSSPQAAGVRPSVPSLTDLSPGQLTTRQLTFLRAAWHRARERAREAGKKAVTCHHFCHCFSFRRKLSGLEHMQGEDIMRSKR